MVKSDDEEYTEEISEPESMEESHVNLKPVDESENDEEANEVSAENEDVTYLMSNQPSMIDNVEDDDNKGKIEENFYENQIFKIKSILENGVLSIENTISLNHDLAMLKIRISENQEADGIYEKIKVKIKKIDQKTFNWKVDYRSIGYLKLLFGLVDVFFDHHHFLFIDYHKLQAVMPAKFFLAFMKEPYHSYDEQDKIFFAVHEFHSLVIRTFKKLYITFPMAVRPKIDSAELNLIDPFIRQHFRDSNKKFFYNTAGLPEDFNLMEFLTKVMEKFVFSGLPRWEQKSGQPLLVPLLNLINECFDYGLVEAKECDLLLSKLYMISELLSSLENEIQRIYTQYDKVIEKYYDEFMACRIAISTIVLHIITVYCDFDYLDSVRELKQNPKSESILRYFLLDKKAAYSNISLIVLKYLSPKLEIAQTKHYSPTLQHNISMIFNFIGDYENDFFTQSLSLIRIEYIEYYLEQIKIDQGNIRIREIVTLINTYLQSVRTFGTANRSKIETDFLGILNKIRELFSTETENIRYRLELSKNNIPALLLQIIDYLDRGNSNNDLINQGIAILGLILKKNYPGQSVLFTGNTFINYKSIFLRRYLMTMNMLQTIFNEDYSIFNLANRVFLTKIKIYKQLLKAFREEYEREQNSPKFLEILGSLFFFNYFFYKILNKNMNKIKHKKRYDIVISSEIVDIMTDYVFPAFYNPAFLNDYNAVNFQNAVALSEIHSFENIKAYFGLKDIKIVLFEIYFSFLKLFNKSVFHVYSGEVYEKVRSFADTINFSNLPSGFPNAICIRLEMLKLFDRFHIFYTNHLLSKRGIYNKNPAVIVGELFIPTNLTELCQKIKNEFDWFEAFLKIPQNSSASNTELIGMYLLKGLLASVYKYLKGILGYVTIMESPDKIEVLKNHCDEIVDMLMSNSHKYKNYIKNTLSKAMDMMITFQNITEASEEKEPMLPIKNRLNNIKETNLPKPNLSPFNNSIPTGNETNFESDVLEERINPNLRIARERITTGLNTIDQIYDINAEYRYVINRYSRNTEIDSYNSYMQKTMRSFHQLETKYSMVYKKLIQDNSLKDKSILQAIKHMYRIKKAYYNQYPNENRFVQYLTKDNNSRSYNRSIAEFFVDQMVNMESCLCINNYEQSFFLNEIYMQYVITMNNLLSWTDLMRKELYNILYASKCKRLGVQLTFEESKIENYDDYNDVSGDTILNFLQAIWGAYLSLLMFTYFKTFMDHEWEEYWGKFFLISSFIQNLCENNFMGFKNLLNEPNFGMIEMVGGATKVGARSVFFENYILLEVLTMNSNFWLNKDKRIVPSDRPELFLMIKQVLENVTEMLNGPCVTNQLKIYIYRIDMWTGIINRIIDDLDSKFYEVKLSCLLYVSALLEGLNDDIVQFMGSNLEVHKLFDLIIILTKKLYLKQKIVEPSKKKGFSNIGNNKANPLNPLLKGMMNIITSHEDPHNVVRSPDQLFAMYNKYEQFSEHIIMNIVISAFVMIKNMSTKIKFYELFLKDKEKIAKKYYLESKLREEAAIYNFISKVIINIEIVNQSNELTTLQKVYFKMPPRCYFLTSEMMNRFIEETPVDSLIAKRNFLYNRLEALSIEMHENQKNFSRFLSLSYIMTNDAFRYYQMVLFIISLCLNVIMLVYLENLDGSGLKSTDSNGNTIIMALGITVACLSFIFTVFWLAIKYKMEVRVLVAKHQALTADSLRKRDKIKIYLIKGLLFHKRFTSFLLQLLFSFLGLMVNKVFFTLNLLLLTNVSKPINYIIRSIINHYDKLLVTLALTILVIFSYSFLLLTFFNDTIDSSTYGDQICHSFVSCFINSINLGLRLGGGIGDSMKIVSSTASTGIFWGRFFFDLSFFIFIRLILLNVIAGIIIDTFSDLRDGLTIRNNHIANICYVCGIDRWNIEQNGIDFDDHIENDHNLWKYLFFLVKLRLSDQRTFGGIEYAIWKKYNKSDSSWIPNEVYLKKGENYRKLEQF